MLENTFCLLPGIGAKTERRLWDAGVLTWEDLLSASAPPAPPLARALAPERLAEARKRLEQRDADYFAALLPAAEQWRLYGDFGDRVAYFDIETTGLSVDQDHITCIALYDGSQVRTYVYGDNLEDFADDIRAYSLLVTFNGKSFDVPVIERQLKIRLPKAHVDLRWVLRALGFRGGLKKCERQIGLSRDELEGVDGALAVLLWHDYRASGDARALETLLAYNVADVLGLERQLKIRLPKAHVDLRWVLRALGFRGGLKKCERQIGLSRDELEGVDGALAVLLWHHYRASGDARALETLLAYNVADVLGLERLLAIAYNRKLEGTPFYLERAIALPTSIENPHRPDAETLARVRGSYTA